MSDEKLDAITETKTEVELAIRSVGANPETPRVNVWTHGTCKTRCRDASQLSLTTIPEPDAHTVFLRLDQSARDIDGVAPELPSWTSKGDDVAYVPRVGHTTGDLDVHDVAVDADVVIEVAPR